MPRARDPRREEARRMWEESGKTMKLRDIASKLQIPEKTISGWKVKDNWDKKNERSTPKNKRSTPKAIKQRTSRAGAPKGNKNAVGFGAPLGNTNARKHGGYSAIFWDTLGEEEREMIEDMDFDGETLLEDEIALLTVRERRIMQSISKYKDAKGGQAVTSVFRSENKREFKSEEERLLYEERQQAKIAEDKLLPGNAYQLATTTEGTYNIVQRLEEALTRCQAQKQRSIDALCRLREKRGSDGNQMVNDWIAAVMGDPDDE